MAKAVKDKCWRFLVPPWGFSDLEEERLYAAYTQRQKERGVPRLLVIGMLLQIFATLVPGERDMVFAYSSVAIGVICNTLLMVLYASFRRARVVVMHVSWLALWVQLLVSASRRVGDAYNELLGWAVVLQYFTLAALSFHPFVLLQYSLASIAAYLFVQYNNALTFESRPPEDIYQQLLANGELLLGATVMGATIYVVGERQQRAAFQETKRSLRDKLTIEQQSKEQERLLLSVLPEHVAVQMRKELGLIDTQFKKIYMSRHENVSILYADIVGFTAISSTYSAQDLVAILNELFARFDRLSEKYKQLRIKILGDCYYCISGAPVERPDHAVLCVHMGLSMVKAIKYVQQTTNSPVDMRVGIHTGAVLAGVLGQRQWQFDVYSRDVELANKMESSGMAGRVHISEVTLGFLNDEFEVEPAHGERREEMLRQAGIKTYFIVKVLKPYQGPEEKIAPEGEGEGGDTDTLSELKDDDEESVLSPQDDNSGNENEQSKIHKMLQEELVNRDDAKELEGVTTCCMMFKSSEMEEAFKRRKDLCPLTVIVPLVCVMPILLTLASFAVPPTWSFYNFYTVSLIVQTGIVSVIFYARVRWAQHRKEDYNPDWKMLCGLLNTGYFTVVNAFHLMTCGYFETVLQDGLREDSLPHEGARRCYHPSYYYHVGAALCCSVLFLMPLRSPSRAAIMLLVAAVHVLPGAVMPALLLPRPSLDKYPYSLPFNATTDFNEQILFVISQIHSVRNVLMLFFIGIGLIIFNKYSEALERARHSRGERMRAQAEQAADLRRRNQALIHNVLPAHVARHFMGARHAHRDLYSQSYGEVGVLFASMPNFTEFYSEETVNNQGLECLRFLNEVISDFDLLLENSKFCNDIIKIKTISSTYMAASGLNPTRQMQPSDGILVRWAHLACLVEFALELQRVLAAINEQSFNHFVLRMGVNHGPITAGVIGARKPHYDIWGNTVNVASRMESTGKAGCIQVTEETRQILEYFGYFFEQRGLVAVKGKGQLMTYYLQGRRDVMNGPNPLTDEVPSAVNVGDSSPLLANGGASISIVPADTNNLDRTSPAANRTDPTPEAAQPLLSTHP